MVTLCPSAPIKSHEPIGRRITRRLRARHGEADFYLVFVDVIAELCVDEKKLECDAVRCPDTRFVLRVYKKALEHSKEMQKLMDTLRHYIDEV